MTQKGPVVVMDFWLEVPENVDDVLNPEHQVVLSGVESKSYKISYVKSHT